MSYVGAPKNKQILTFTPFIDFCNDDYDNYFKRPMFHKAQFYRFLCPTLSFPVEGSNTVEDDLISFK